MAFTGSLTQSDVWKALQAHHQSIEHEHMRDMFAANPSRFEQFHIDAAGLSLDYSKNRINDDTMKLLFKLARQQNLTTHIAAMFNGEKINGSEGRPALHTALRNFGDRDIMVDGENIMPEVRDTVRRMEEFCWKIRRNQWRGYSNKTFTDVVSIGIGGSFLGPKLASSALKPYWDSRLSIHYLANIDGSHITEILKRLDPATTLFIIQSKSFSTQETLKNANACRQWFLDNGGEEHDLAKHFTAVSSNIEKATAFGIAEENIFPMWDWMSISAPHH